MDLKLVSKNNLGVVTALILVILLSQGRFFNFLLDTALGRAILILFILFISYTNKILGVVSVLFIIIMFNNSDIGYMEGFTTDINATANIELTDEEKQQLLAKLQEKEKPALTDEQKQKLLSTIQEKAKEKDIDTVASSSSAATTSSGAEGFDMPTTERDILKGKQSNSIAVDDYNKQSENVEPFSSYGSNFSDTFAAF
jgi:hypothetical protein